MSVTALAQTLSAVTYNGSDVVIGMSESSSAKVFAIGEGKPRVVIDFPSAKVNLNGKTLKGGPIMLEGQNGVKRVRVAARESGVRVVLDLNHGVSLRKHVISGDELVVSLKGGDKKYLLINLSK